MKELASRTDRRIFGTLGSVSLNDIIQLLGMSRRTATLELRRGDERGRVYFKNGQIVHVMAGRYEGEESFIELLGWGDAEFTVEEGIQSLPKISITKSTEALLLSTMTALDEVGRLTGKPTIGVAPSITERRLPPRPKPRPTRSSRMRPFMLGAVVATVLGSAAIAAALLSPAAPWSELPELRLAERSDGRTANASDAGRLGCGERRLAQRRIGVRGGPLDDDVRTADSGDRRRCSGDRLSHRRRRAVGARRH